MKVTKISNVKGEDKSADTIFTGGTVEIQFLTGTGIPDQAKEPEPLAALQVTSVVVQGRCFIFTTIPRSYTLRKGKESSPRRKKKSK